MYADPSYWVIAAHGSQERVGWPPGATRYVQSCSSSTQRLASGAHNELIITGVHQFVFWAPSEPRRLDCSSGVTQLTLLQYNPRSMLIETRANVRYNRWHRTLHADGQYGGMYCSPSGVPVTVIVDDAAGIVRFSHPEAAAMVVKLSTYCGPPELARWCPYAVRVLADTQIDMEVGVRSGATAPMPYPRRAYIAHAEHTLSARASSLLFSAKRTEPFVTSWSLSEIRVSYPPGYHAARPNVIAVRFWPAGLRAIVVRQYDGAARLQDLAGASLYTHFMSAYFQARYSDTQPRARPTVDDVDLDSGRLLCAAIDLAAHTLSIYQDAMCVYSVACTPVAASAVPPFFAFITHRGTPFELVDETEVQRTWILLRLRALAIGGRATATSASSQLAWLLSAAPLWVVVHVCALVRCARVSAVTRHSWNDDAPSFWSA